MSACINCCLSAGSQITILIHHSASMFPLQMWSIQDATFLNAACTDIACEGWNNAFASIVDHSHPSMWTTQVDWNGWGNSGHKLPCGGAWAATLEMHEAFDGAPSCHCQLYLNCHNCRKTVIDGIPIKKTHLYQNGANRIFIALNTFSTKMNKKFFRIRIINTVNFVDKVLTFSCIGQ